MQCLKGDGESPFDEGLQLNAAAGISVLAQRYFLFYCHHLCICSSIVFVICLRFKIQTGLEAF